MATPITLDSALAEIGIEAEAIFTELLETDPNPVSSAEDIQRVGEAVVNVLEGYIASLEPAFVPGAPLPPLLCYDEEGNVSWMDVIRALLQRSYEAAAVPGAKVAAGVPDALSIKEAVSVCEGVRHDLMTAVDGKRPRLKKVQALHAHLFGGRSVMQSRPAWEAELATLIANIRSAGEVPELGPTPRAVLAFIPVLQAALAGVNASRPKNRAAGQAWIYSRPLQVALMALDVGMGQLLAWSASAAPPKTKDALRRVIDPKRQPDTAAKPAEPTPVVETPLVAITPAANTAPAAGPGPAVSTALAAGTAPAALSAPSTPSAPATPAAPARPIPA